MMPWRTIVYGVELLLIGTMALGGCSFGRERPTQLYVLTPISAEPSAPTAPTGRRIAIGIGPVALPRYVERPQIMTGDTSHELRPAAFAQWAEPLRDNVVRVLAENVSRLLETDRVLLFPWKSPGPLDYQIVVEVTQFLGNVGGEATLIALWSILGTHGQAVLVSQKSVLRTPTEGHDYEALAAAMSHLVADLSRAVVAAIRTLETSASR